MIPEESGRSGELVNEICEVISSKIDRLLTDKFKKKLKNDSKRKKKIEKVKCQ